MRISSVERIMKVHGISEESVSLATVHSSDHLVRYNLGNFVNI